ncbi:hypothetical protein CH35J_000241 [Colletotrichum higginsianum]|uniref:Uncharacterized protein n=1 Tax=Colletotrichum higginsianum TaxID=80884 RepID=A0A4T0WKQ0_9PEZI|nr:hypothetical protein CH35J_000241 [Colletotrichum higginsianum]
MRGLAQALLIAPVLVGAAPSRIGMEKADQHDSPSTFITFDIPPGFNEDQPKPYTLHLQVLEAPSPCAYPNIKVNDNTLSQGGHTLGRGTFAGDHDGTTFIASWSSTCAGDEQLLRFTLESLAGRSLASDLAFVARFRQTAPAAIIEVVGDIRLSDHRPLPPPSKALPEFDHHDPRPGDDEDGLLENPPFPPPPHHHVGDHPDNHPGDHRDGDHRHRPSGRPASSPEDDEHVLAELRELDCLRHQLHALKHAIHEKESRLARDHGVVPHRGGRHRAFKECDSLKCVIDTLMHRVGGGFRRKGEGRHGGPGRDHHHGPPASCPGFPFPEHGNHTNGNHTLPLPPPPPGFCHCAPPPPEGPPKVPRRPP